MQIKKLKLIGKLEEGATPPLTTYECDLYINDSVEPTKHVKSISFEADTGKCRNGKPGVLVKLEVYVEELELDLEEPETEVVDLKKRKSPPATPEPRMPVDKIVY